MKLNVIFLAIVLFLSGVLSGCSLSIIHPPSAAAFMEQGDGDLQKNVTASYMWRNGPYKDKVFQPYNKMKSSLLPNEDYYYEDWEWNFQASFDIQKRFENFKIGGGLDWLTPFLQLGYVSDYFGVMGWSNICSWQIGKYEHAYVQWGGGITIIEQLPFCFRKLRIGLTQHISRNGRESYMRDGSDMFSYGSSAPIFYDEIGAGAYVAGIVGKRLGMGLEFRYGRDLTYKIVEKEHERAIHRFTLALNVQWW